ASPPTDPTLASARRGSRTGSAAPAEGNVVPSWPYFLLLILLVRPVPSPEHRRTRAASAARPGGGAVSCHRRHRPPPIRCASHPEPTSEGRPPGRASILCWSPSTSATSVSPGARGQRASRTPLSCHGSAGTPAGRTPRKVSTTGVRAIAAV